MQDVDRHAAIRTRLRRLQPAASRLGAALLRVAPARLALNRAYERGGPSLQRYITGGLMNARIGRQFTWWSRVGGRRFAIPVLPEAPRTWNAALAWGWPGNRVVRAFYELYLAQYPTGAFLDVGANDGTHTYPFAAHGYRCVCVEPQPDCVAFIERVRDANGFGNVVVSATAVSDAPGDDVEFFVSDNTWHSSLIRGEVEHYQESRAIRVPLTTLDALCADLDLRPALMKVDVEGVEDRAIAGARRMLADCRPAALIEVRAQPEIRRPIWAAFSALDYRVYALNPWGQTPFDRVRSEQEFLAAGEHPEMADFVFLSEPDFADRFEAAFGV